MHHTMGPEKFQWKVSAHRVWTKQNYVCLKLCFVLPTRMETSSSKIIRNKKFLKAQLCSMLGCRRSGFPQLCWIARGRITCILLHFAGSMFHRTKDIDEDLPYQNGDMEQHKRWRGYWQWDNSGVSFASPHSLAVSSACSTLISLTSALNVNDWATGSSTKKMKTRNVRLMHDSGLSLKAAMSRV